MKVAATENSEDNTKVGCNFSIKIVPERSLLRDTSKFVGISKIA